MRGGVLWNGLHCPLFRPMVKNHDGLLGSICLVRFVVVFVRFVVVFVLSFIVNLWEA